MKTLCFFEKLEFSYPMTTCHRSKATPKWGGCGGALQPPSNPKKLKFKKNTDFET